jgi:hypothetical protein
MSPVNLTPATRLFGICARAADRAVIIRRGPSKHVMLLTWDTRRHEFQSGQWLKGRIYEERCDLSPSGDKFIYLAASQKPPYYSWTAVSRPPYLTALALWPNMGTWGGGGLFEAERIILVNRMGGPGKMAPDFRLPRNVRVLPIAPWAGRGEDEPIRSLRMKRDGWVLADEGVTREFRWNAPVSWEFVKPQRWRKTCGPHTLEMRLLGIGERNGPWYVREHRLLAADDSLVADFGRSDWADWSHSGELLMARDGKLLRMRSGAAGELDELIDLNGMRFEQVPPTPGALRWDGNRIYGRKIK